LYQKKRQIGVARIITDFATYAYICDVFIDRDFRGRRLGSWLMVCILEHPDLKGLKRISLLTRDAQDFYRRFGFVHLEDSCRYMEFLNASR
jgi:ribosomal protein S18 acetylase RimI-like enzyme